MTTNSKIVPIPVDYGLVLTAKQKEVVLLFAADKTHIGVAGGSRSGKTFLIVRTIVARALNAAGSRHAILRFRRNAVRSAIWMDTLPKVLKLCFPEARFTMHESDLICTFANGSEIWLGGLDDKVRVEKILGNEFVSIFLNECSQIPYASALVARTRLAQKVKKLDGTYLRLRMYYDLNPLGFSHWTYKIFQEHKEPDSGMPLPNPDMYAMIFMNPEDNADNLPPGYIEELDNLPARQRVRFREGKYQADVAGALWTLETIEASRVTLADVPPNLTIVAVGVDPSGTSGDEDKRSDEVGIIVAGIDEQGFGYVLGDYSTGQGPAGWGSAVVDAWDTHEADHVVGEVNYGGDMVRFVVLQAAKDRDLAVPVRKVTASRGKAIRAEPVSVLFEQGMVFLVGKYPKLEEQMLNMTSDGYKGHRSPDRLDAMVWVLTDLMVRKGKGKKLGAPLTVGGMSGNSVEGAPHLGGVLTERSDTAPRSVTPEHSMRVGAALIGNL